MTICEPDRVGDRGAAGETSSATPFPELNDLLTNRVRVRSILDANLVGVYLTGSFALGGGDAASDCDFLVVTTGLVGDERACASPAARGDSESGGLLGVQPRRLVRTESRSPDAGSARASWLYVNRGGREMEWSAHCNTEESDGYYASGH